MGGCKVLKQLSLNLPEGSTLTGDMAYNATTLTKTCPCVGHPDENKG